MKKGIWSLGVVVLIGLMFLTVGALTASDIIYEVNYVFKGGTPPCDICNDPGAMACVP